MIFKSFQSRNNIFDHFIYPYFDIEGCFKVKVVDENAKLKNTSKEASPRVKFKGLFQFFRHFVNIKMPNKKGFRN